MDLMFQGVDVVGWRGDPAAIDVTSITLDSRQVTPGALFCCLVGGHADGHDHAAGAVAAGATALLVERPLDLDAVEAEVRPGAARHAMALAACAFHGHPAAGLTTVGVTGTNGKTSVTHLVRSIFDAARRPATVIGTLDGARTTPEAPELQRRLAAARADGQEVVAVEVSSHALVQGRVDGFQFSAAVFTNLSHDHLDYHANLDDYFAAKARLFTPDHAALGVVNIADRHGRRLADGAAIPVVGFSPDDAADVELAAGRTTFTWRGRRVTLPLTGAFHVVNAVAAATTAAALDVDIDAIVAGLARVPPVPGRFEIVAGPDPFTVVVDYAHTPDGLAVALDSARQLAAGRRVVAVVGCGGDRDREKRPAMGATAAAGADLTVITSDNPRSEPPMAIIDAIRAGVPAGAAVDVEIDRRAAIGRAVAAAAPGDVVLIAGKGHETVIEAAGRTVPFDDRVEARAAFARRRTASQGPTP